MRALIMWAETMIVLGLIYTVGLMILDWWRK